MIFVSLVPVHEVQRVWPKIRQYVVGVEEISHGRTNVTEIFSDIMEGKMLLWVIFEYNIEAANTEFMAFACTSIREYPKRRMLYIDYIGGDHMEKWIGNLNETLSTFGASQECDGLESTGRRGWERPLKNVGWTPVYTTYEKMFKAPKALNLPTE
jgi:hypothetical protein